MSKEVKANIRKRIINIATCIIPIKKWRKAVREYLKYELRFTISTKNKIKKLPFFKDEKYCPLVSIIVPNYNHEAYLRDRLESIYNQTYKNYEVILLDDCSTDKSRDVLQEYCDRYSSITKVVFNEKNSGGVFFQWKKGIELAKGELIWIAESDDWCNSTFLASLVNYFQDASIMISFGYTHFMKKGKEVWNIEKYLNDTNYKYNKKFIETSNNLVANAWAYKNIIPNVSSAVFRNTGFERIFSNSDWYKFKVCGDWIFYLDIIRGGKVAYDPRARNYYRQHDHNTSLSLHSRPQFYKEHENISIYIMENFSVPEVNFYKLENSLWHMYKSNVNENKNDFILQYNINNILSIQRKSLNILIASYAFSTGGGETFPIYLANELYKRGHSITFYIHNFDNINKEIRNLLNKSIPIIYYDNYEWNDLFECFGIDTCYSGHLSVDYDIAMSKKTTKTKHCITLHGMYECTEKDILSKRISLIYNNADNIIYIADKNLVPFRDNNLPINHKFIKLPNGLPETTISCVSKNSLNIPDQAFTMCVVSRAIPEKGWHEAIQATNILKERTKKDIHLILCGDGEVCEELKGNVPPNIHLLGFVKNTRDYIKMCNLFLLPTRFKGESFPLVIIDAIFCNTPVIASNVGEIKNMLTVNDSVFGNVFDLEKDGTVSVNKLASTIEEFLTTKDNKNYANILSNLKQRYDIKHVAKLYEDIYCV